MPSRRFLSIIVCLSVSATLAGCAQSGSLLSNGTNVGTLKTSLSHMEYENQQLRRENASLKAEVRQTEDRLVQEESANEDLSSRLGNALALLKGRGMGEGEVADTGPARPGTTLPAGRSNRKPRKPPFARIPGHLDALPPDSESDGELPNGWGSSGARSGNDPGPQSRLENPAVWLPVARGITSPSVPRR